MKVRDSRRVTGPNLYFFQPGAVLEIEAETATEQQLDRAVEAWKKQARALLDAVGGAEDILSVRRFPSGVGLALSAPFDVLYSATELNEAAWDLAMREIAGAAIDLQPSIDALWKTIREERHHPALALSRAAAQRGVTFLWDDDAVSIGLGKGSLTFQADAVPSPDTPEWEAIDWDSVHDLPTALVTGTNGKTTTVRLLAEMVRAAGLEPGVSSTDGCWVCGEEIGEGDYSGPGGARLVLRDHRVEIAILETARGGMSRRGLALQKADVAVVTNVAEDHLGEWGVEDLAALAEVKFLVAQVTEQLVVNGDDPQIRGVDFSGKLDHFHAESLPAGSGSGVDGDVLVLIDDAGERHELGHLEEIPITLGGAARHNTANALAASCAAYRLGLPLAAIREGLKRFTPSSEDNPGRLNLFELGGEGAAGVRAIVDFAHNPHGFDALLAMGASLRAERWAVLLGQAGDRDDVAISELARQAAARNPDRVILKELVKNLRGRAEGEVVELLAETLQAAGLDASTIERATSETAAVRQALAWSRPGDVLLLVIHEERSAVLELLAGLQSAGWKAGEALPSA